MWISSEIHYERVKIRKKTWFGYRRKLGYRLTKPLRYKWKDGVFFVLGEDYIWDGPSYFKILGWLVGRKTSEGSLASSAMHDTADKIPTRYVFESGGKKQMGHTNFNISDGAKLYAKMLREWPDPLETVTDEQSKRQKIGLIIFQPFYSFMNQSNDWELDQD